MPLNWISLTDFETDHCFVTSHSVSIFDRWDWIKDQVSQQFECKEDDVIDLDDEREDGRSLVTLNGKPVAEIHHRRVINPVPVSVAVSADTKKRYLAAKMIGRLEGVVASGAMSESLEISTRELIRDACEAFGMPTISERAA